MYIAKKERTNETHIVDGFKTLCEKTVDNTWYIEIDYEKEFTCNKVTCKECLKIYKGVKMKNKKKV